MRDTLYRFDTFYDPSRYWDTWPICGNNILLINVLCVLFESYAIHRFISFKIDLKSYMKCYLATFISIKIETWAIKLELLKIEIF